MGSGAFIAGITVQILLYTDDIVLSFDSPELQRHLNALKIFFYIQRFVVIFGMKF